MSGITFSILAHRGNLSASRDACQEKEKADQARERKADQASLPCHTQERICLGVAPLSDCIHDFVSERSFLHPALPEGL